MRTRPIPGSELSVSEVGVDLRCLARGWWGDDGDSEAIALLRAAHGAGITLFDASQAGYRGERALATALRGARGMVRMVALAPDRPTGSRRARELPEDLLDRLDRRLRGYGWDRVEIVVCDDPRPEVATGLRERGLAEVVAWHDPDPARRSARADLVRAEVNLLAEPRSSDGAPHPVLASDPLAMGLLEGKYTAQTVFPPGDPRADLGGEWLTEGLARVAALRFLAEDRPWTLAQAALRWTLSEPGVAAALVDVTSEVQLAEVVAVASVPPLSVEDQARLRGLRDPALGTESAAAAAGAG